MFKRLTTALLVAVSIALPVSAEAMLSGLTTQPAGTVLAADPGDPINTHWG